MMQDSNEFIDWAIKGILAASFAGWALVIRYFGGKYISSNEEIIKRLVSLEKEIAVLKAANPQLVHYQENNQE